MSAVATSCPAAQPQDVASANKTNFLRLDQKWISLIRVHLVAIIFYNALEFEDFIVDPPWIQSSTVFSVFAVSIYMREIWEGSEKRHLTSSQIKLGTVGY